MGRVNIEGGPFESCFVPNGVGGDVKVPLNEVACICVYMSLRIFFFNSLYR